MNDVMVGRKQEISIINDMLDSHKAEFLALYGRRRIGKTYLINTLINQRSDTFFRTTGIRNSSQTQQLKVFSQSLSDCFYKGESLTPKKDWFEALESLHNAINNYLNPEQKIILFFDEFPWMATPKSRLLQALDYYWNHYWSHDGRVKLIICGSSAAWIIRKIINDKGGLHNRITHEIALKPFRLKDIKALLNSKNIQLTNKQIAEIYMVTGGVPYYLANPKKGASATQIIEHIAFSENSLLFKEFDNLFSSLFKNPEVYIDILRILSTKLSGVSQSEIITKSKYFNSGGTAIKKLQELIDTGFIAKFKTFGHKKRGAFYRLIDEYTLFYFQWIEPLRDSLQSQALDPGYWEHIRESGEWKAWAGYSFESICYQHIPQIRKALDLNPTAIPHTWRYQASKGSQDQGAQIDLLFDRRDECITLCEIKFTNKPFSLDKTEAHKIITRNKVFTKNTGTQKHLFNILISAQGIKPTMYSEEIISNVVTLDDLFAD